ncbi:fimbrillin family protein [Elizabethkingia anophelis]|uniref:fimbrillin family protein n=1 Tax=Elizabethkingia anophelis TaxID=1117645 RepID=UPI00136C7A81|nr:fimbrillin family protein [Elizabethkingia anophelis]MCT4121731.1 fimbrillin family protein [Elizabethkingia anophelis]
MSNKFTSYFRTISVGITLSTALFFQSCSNRETATEEVGSGEQAQLMVNIEGIMQEVSTDPQAGTKAAGGFATIQAPKEINFTESIKAATSVTQQPMDQNTGRSIHNAVAATVQLPTQPMTKDYTYRVVMYNVDGSFHSATNFVAGMPGSIEVSKGQKYKWIAYSYNNNAAIPAITDNQNPTIATAVDKDLLYASGEVTIGTSPQGEQLTQALPITFEHKMSKISLAINARGMNATIDNIAVVMRTPVSFNQGILDLKTGAMQANGSVNYATGDPITFQNSAVYGSAVKEAFFYTTQSTGALNVNLKHNVIDVSIDGVSESLIGSGQTVTTDFAATPAPGKNTNLNVNLYKIGGTIGGVTWATGNLYYDYGSGQQKIRPSDIKRWSGTTYAQTDYWRGRALTAAEDAIPDQVDPCTKVFPEDTWRLPTYDEFNILVGRRDRDDTQYDSNGTNNAVSFAADNGKRVNFNPDGRKWTGLSIQQENIQGFYWTSTRNGSSGDVFYNFQSGGSRGDVLMRGSYQADGDKLNIRCVRNKK